MNLFKNIVKDIKKSINETEDERLQRKKAELAKIKKERKALEEKEKINKELQKEKDKLREIKFGF